MNLGAAGNNNWRAVQSECAGFIVQPAKTDVQIGNKCRHAGAGIGQVSGIQPTPFAPGGDIGRLFGVDPSPFMVFDFVRENGGS